MKTAKGKLTTNLQQTCNKLADDFEQQARRSRQKKNSAEYLAEADALRSLGRDLLHYERLAMIRNRIAARRVNK